MATWSANIASANKQITLDLRSVFYTQNLEFLIDGSLNGCVVSLYRQVLNPITNTLTNAIPMNISWSDQTQYANFTQALAGLVADLKPEGNLVIKFLGGAPSLTFCIVGTATNKDITSLVVNS